MARCGSYRCIAERIRQQDDGVNRIIAGGASGVAVAWKTGPLGALQSGVLLAAMSWLFDFSAGTVPAAKAAALRGGCSSGACSVSVGRVIGARGPSSAEGGRRRVAALRPRMLAAPGQVLGTPVVMWMGPLVSSSYFSPPALSLSLQAQ
ncbi:hypothetical protein TSOC_011044 [Tetrabaena socialis]|uniref:Uncharacterized protein n=1 Tax=Tetrabaena socialis TaxID=47790 RepID=A0A2J7ZRN3_9CHLO|nr:hypothetical protein TSOC_011044 [Tetrabaena socialis]|eukprot:PNH02926.1 hypothetical protein TSOC_011044 [Tetrabaena socialis]